MKRFKFILFTFLCLLLLCGLLACEGGKDYTPSRKIVVVLLGGDHYSVVGGNRRTVQRGETVIFDIELERGYKIVSSFGDDCSFTEDRSFSQTVTFESVTYSVTAQLQTEEVGVAEFEVVYDENSGEIGLTSALGCAEEDGTYYNFDSIDLSATPKNGYRFVCWSSGGYLSDGGSFYGYDPNILLTDVSAISKLYANFKEIADMRNTLVYKLETGREIEQNCSVQLQHHYRANTYTAQDMRNMGVDCDSRLLAGWRTADGEYVGLGSRTKTADTEVVLTPVWKAYTPEEYFTAQDGVLTDFTAESEECVVIPNSIGGGELHPLVRTRLNSARRKSFIFPIRSTRSPTMLFRIA